MKKKSKWPKTINVRLTQKKYDHLGKCKSGAVRKMITADMSKEESPVKRFAQKGYSC